MDEFSVEKHHVYVTLFYDIRNRRVIHIEEEKESDVFGKFINKHPFMDTSKIDHITMDMYPSYISGAKKYLPKSEIVFDHFHVIKMMNDTLDRIRRKEARENDILKHTRYQWLKNYSDLSERERGPFTSPQSCKRSSKFTNFRPFNGSILCPLSNVFRINIRSVSTISGGKIYHL
ncbi:ISL3 family transposase [Cuniculiplasma sp. SKW4]|uniref:ISL3 family transposase n=1 Tax=Cuniculiplasma sp. SKW4 TaxID=3400171 RepID=UPI003FD2D2D8